MTAAVESSGYETIEFHGAHMASLSTEDAVQAILKRAAEQQASDLFLLTDARYITVATHCLGRMERLAVLSTEFGRQVISYIKAYADMDISDKRRPADARWIVHVAHRTLDLRINCTPTLHGEDLAIRISDHSLPLLALSGLGLSSSDQSKMEHLLCQPHGMLLVTGPTGAGKTTTLYACLRHLNDGSKKINTLEDPIEYALDGVRQSQVHPKLSLNFAELLRNILRQAPHVVMIGEIRDRETMTTAIQAANSGLLVLATLHATTAAGSIQSMLTLEANPCFLANSLLGVVFQRLVRTLCPQCRTRRNPSNLPIQLQEFLRSTEPGQELSIYGPVGCEHCHQLGYSGRTGLFEIMPINRKLRRMIAQSATTEELQLEAVSAGMVELRRAALSKVAQGLTSTDEILPELAAEQLGLVQ